MMVITAVFVHACLAIECKTAAGVGVQSECPAHGGPTGRAGVLPKPQQTSKFTRTGGG